MVFYCIKKKSNSHLSYVFLLERWLDMAVLFCPLHLQTWTRQQNMLIMLPSSTETTGCRPSDTSSRSCRVSNFCQNGQTEYCCRTQRGFVMNSEEWKQNVICHMTWILHLFPTQRSIFIAAMRNCIFFSQTIVTTAIFRFASGFRFDSGYAYL